MGVGCSGKRPRSQQKQKERQNKLGSVGHGESPGSPSPWVTWRTVPLSVPHIFRVCPTLTCALGGSCVCKGVCGEHCLSPAPAQNLLPSHSGLALGLTSLFVFVYFLQKRSLPGGVRTFARAGAGGAGRAGAGCPTAEGPRHRSRSHTASKQLKAPCSGRPPCDTRPLGKGTTEPQLSILAGGGSRGSRQSSLPPTHAWCVQGWEHNALPRPKHIYILFTPDFFLGPSPLLERGHLGTPLGMGRKYQRTQDVGWGLVRQERE